MSRIAVAFEGTRDHVQDLAQESIVGYHFCHVYDFHVLGPDMSCLFVLHHSASLHDWIRECSGISGVAEVGVPDIS